MGGLVEAVTRNAGPPPILRMFERSRSRPRLVELPPVRTIFEDFAKACAGVLAAMGATGTTVRLELLEQGAPAVLLPHETGSVGVLGHIPEWGALGMVQFDALLLFRLLDIMFGGDAARLKAAPVRPLTALEKALAARVANSTMGQLQAGLAKLCPFSFDAVRCLEPLEPDGLGQPKDGHLVVRLRLAPFGEGMAVVIPAAGLELARERIDGEESRAEPDPDPGWSEAFKRSVGATSLALAAVADGPPMTLAEVGRLQPGALLEFDARALARVRLESHGTAVLVGRLVQSRGMFTVSIEALVSGGDSQVKREVPGEPRRG